MVKRTLIVLSILSLMVVAAGTSSAFNGCGSSCAPLFVPVDCCPYPTPTTIVKTWSCKIEGPCPAPGPMCGAPCKQDSGFSLCKLLGSMPGPLDFLFGGCDGVYGCTPGFGDKGCDSGCGPCFGPVACALAGVPMLLGSVCPNDCMMFGTCW